eukprot:7377210-Prymnesium_polylepis.1
MGQSSDTSMLPSAAITTSPVQSEVHGSTFVSPFCVRSVFVCPISSAIPMTFPPAPTFVVTSSQSVRNSVAARLPLQLFFATYAATPSSTGFF